MLATLTKKMENTVTTKDRRKSASSVSTPATLLPASKRARLEEVHQTAPDDNSDFDESKMDNDIRKHFKGKLKAP